MDARSRLLVWMEKTRMQQAELAKELGCSRSFVSFVLSGRKRPGLQLASAIERLTGIPASTWASAAPSTDPAEQNAAPQDVSPTPEAAA